MKWKLKHPEEFIRAVVKGMHQIGDQIFTESQIEVPVDEGTLKKSGVPEYLENGFRITYRTSYAAKQEFGLPPGHTESVRGYRVRRYTRKTGKRSGGKRVIVPAHNVGSHSRTYKKGLQGKFYLTGPYNRARPKLIKFIAEQHKKFK